MKLVFLLSLVFSALVEYRFGHSFGKYYYDFSLNKYHGMNCKNNPSRTTDRGLYLKTTTNVPYCVMVPRNFSTPSIFSALFWTLATDGDGLIFFMNSSSSEYLYVLQREKDYNKFMFLYYSGGTSTVLNATNNSYLSSKFYIDGWKLISFLYDGTSFKVEVDGVPKLTDTRANSASSNTIGLGSILTLPPGLIAMYWNFIVIDGIYTITSYMGSGLTSTCIVPYTKCSECFNRIKDPVYMEGCLLISTAPDYNSNGNLCESSNPSNYGCSNTIAYTCTYEFCSYKPENNKCYSINPEDGSETQITCTCQTKRSLVNKYCCNPGCSDCNFQGNCTSCLDPHASPANGWCYCNIGYYGSPSINSTSCIECGSGCLECNSKNSCSKCTNYSTEVISKNECVCNSGFYFSNIKTCSLCGKGCLECDSVNYCSQCILHSAVVNLSNECRCNYGYYFSSETACSLCGKGCLECSSVNECLVCTPQSTKVASKNECMCDTQHYFSDDKTCTMCGKGCLQCNSATDCQLCTTNSIKVTSKNECICNSGFYFSDNVTCSSCGSGCETCNSTDCLKCLYQNSIIQGKNCYCSGYIEITNMTCLPCSDGCKSCESLSKCLSCYDIQASPSGATCACPERYFIKEGFCFACGVDCKTCNSSDICQICLDGSQPINGNCSCSSGLYRLGDICVDCPKSCLNCSSNSDCSACLYANSFFNGTECVCDIGYYETNTGCNQCGLNCKECNSLNNCISCLDSNSRIENNSCYCNERFYELNSICNPCEKLCRVCSSTECINCVENANKSASACECIDGFYESQGVCHACLGMCKTCINSSTCIECLFKGSIQLSDNCLCPVGTFNNSLECLPCPQGCVECSSLDNCLNCLYNHTIPIGGICKCSPGFYGQINNCASCISECVECESLENCTKCSDSLASPVNGICECKPGNYRDGNCKSCIDGCISCHNHSSCEQCADQFAYFFNGSCTCKEGYFNDSGCVACPKDCKICYNLTYCEVCSDQFALFQNGECKCSQGYFNESGCKPCPDGCQICQNSTSCESCYDSHSTFSNLTCKCPIGFYNNSGCHACPPGCEKCENSSSCQQCQDPFATFSNGQCQCNQGFYNSSGCKPCLEGCKMCFDLNSCDYCLDQYASFSNGSCRCNQGYFNDSVCKPCTEGCKICHNSFSCDECTDGFAIFNNGSCTCKPGYFNSSVCLPCSTGCEKCLNFSTCEKCMDQNAEPIGNLCVCKTGFFNESICKPCKLGCSSCTSLNDCSSCIDLNSNFNGTDCVCNPGYFDYNNDCLACDTSCLECNLTSCTTCKYSNSFPLSSTCQCLEGFYFDSSAQTCKICPLGCKNCSDYTTCYQCFDPLQSFSNNKCICPPGYYGESQCLNCSPGCLSCISSENCVQCIDPFALISSGECFCTEGQFMNLSSFTCQSCALNCSKCVSPSECLTCSSANSVTKNGVCVCAANYYLKASGDCNPCDPSCEDCDEFLCHKCKSNNSEILGSKCNCLQGFFNANLSGLQCEKCFEECSSCKNSSLCESCLSLNSSPNSSKGCSCDKGFWASSSLVTNDSCKPCKEDCLNCSSEYNCVECADQNKIVFKGVCISKCVGSKYYLDGCHDCPRLCDHCQNFHGCTTCKMNSVFDDKGICECERGFKEESGNCEDHFFDAEFSVSDLNRIRIDFTHPLVLNDSDIKAVLLEKKFLHFSIVSKSNTSYTILPKIEDSLVEKMRIDLILRSPIYSFYNSKLRQYNFSAELKVQPNAEIKKLSTQAKATTQTVATSSMSFSLVSNPSACWTLLNTVQIISYLPLNSLPYTPKLHSFHASLASYNFLPNPFEYFISPDSSSEPYKQAKAFGINTSVFLLNFGSTLAIPLAYLVILPILLIFSCIPVISPYAKKYLIPYKYSFFIRFIIQSYLEIGIFSLIQLNSSDLAGISGYINYAISGFFLVYSMQVVLLLSPIISTYLIYNLDFEDELTIKKYGSLFSEFKNNRGKFSSMFYSIYFIKRLVFFFSQIYLNDDPAMQVALSIFVTLAQLIHLLYYLPFKDKSVFISELTGEICTLFVFSVVSLLLRDNSPDDLKLIEDLIIYSIFASGLVQYLICLYSVYKSIKDLFQKLLNSRAERFLRSAKELSIENKFPSEINTVVRLR